MPIYDHTGAAKKFVGPDGRAYAVYVMGPSGLITIDPGVTFSPASSEASGNGRYLASVTLNCSINAVWTVSVWGGATSNIPSGSTSTSLRLSISSPGTVGKRTTVTGGGTVTATAGGSSHTWTVTLVSQGDIRGIE